MKMKMLLSLALILSFGGSAKAWNCSDPLAARVPVPAGTKGSFGDGDGQLFTGRTGEGIPGQLYQCQVPSTDPKSGAQHQKQNQSQTQSSDSTSNSKSSSNSNATANGGNSKSSSTAQSGNATGGSVSGSGNSQSTLKNSGNSSNANTNNTSATGGNQSQTASAANNSTGNTSTYNSTTDIQEAKIPVNTAIGIAPPATLNCALGYGGGVQTAGLGISGAFSRVDKNCANLTVALTARNRLTYCKVWIKNKYVKEAGVTLEDCMLESVVPVVVPVAAPLPVAPPESQRVDLHVTVDQPEPVARITSEVEQHFPFDSFSLVNGHLTNSGKRKLDDAVLRLRNKPDAKLRIIGPLGAAQSVAYLRGKIAEERILQNFADDQNSTVTLELVWVN